MSMVGFIYKYENKINHKVYIGQTTDLINRRSCHKHRATFEKNKFYNAVRKYGWDNFNYDIIAQVEVETPQEMCKVLDALEEQYIKEYDSYNSGYNSTTGGQSCRGRKMPETYREYCRNRTYSEETRKKMSEAAKKRVVSDKTKEKQRKHALKRNFAKYRELTTEKRNAAIKEAKSKTVLQLDQFGNVINEFYAIQDAVKYILDNLTCNRKEAAIWHGLYRHYNKITKKKLYYGYEWKLKAYC